MITNKYNPRDRYDLLEVQYDAPLLEYLIKEMKGVSKSKVKATLSGHGIKVNGKFVTQFDYQLRKGMRISISKTKKNNMFRNRFVKIVYEDKYIVVVEKATGILSVPTRPGITNVKSVLDKYFRDSHQNCNAHVVHRLDRETSGLMVFAKDIKTQQIFEYDWTNIVYDRKYIAVLSGEMEEDEGTIANWLKDDRFFVTYSSPVDNGGKYAVSHFRTLRRSTEHSLVEFTLESGRKNQIRVHSCDLGHPVCGDNRYGNGDDPIHRLCLEAYILRMFHPVTHERMEFELPIPSQFKMILNGKTL